MRLGGIAVPTDDYIKRSDAIRAFAGVPNDLYYTCGIVEALEKIPAADVEPVRHGRWIEKKKNMTEGAAYMIPLIIKYFVCSLCGREEDIAEPYCNCGAKMDAEPPKGEENDP
jgi:hypothetical protein